MGCDIHIVAERKNPTTGLYEPWGTFTERHGSFVQDGPKEFMNEIYEGRNYTLFGVLAGVRGGDDHMIAPPRGLPTDMSPEVAKYHEDVDHTPSYLTLRELLEFDWTTPIRMAGAIAWPHYLRFKCYAEDQPQSWCGWTSARTISEEEADAMRERMTPEERIATIRNNDDHGLYVGAEWDVPLFVRCKEFLSTTIPRLLAFGKGYDPSDVRIVFHFDN
jgi:hypothetical protein